MDSRSVCARTLFNAVPFSQPHNYFLHVIRAIGIQTQIRASARHTYTLHTHTCTRTHTKYKMYCTSVNEWPSERDREMWQREKIMHEKRHPYNHLWVYGSKCIFISKTILAWKQTRIRTFADYGMKSVCVRACVSNMGSCVCVRVVTQSSSLPLLMLSVIFHWWLCGAVSPYSFHFLSRCESTERKMVQWKSEHSKQRQRERDRAEYGAMRFARFHFIQHTRMHSCRVYHSATARGKTNNKDRIVPNTHTLEIIANRLAWCDCTFLHAIVLPFAMCPMNVRYVFFCFVVKIFSSI